MGVFVFLFDMVYVSDWDEFVAAATKLFQSKPKKTRYTVKFRGEDKVVVLKVTDDGEKRLSFACFFFFFFFLSLLADDALPQWLF